MNMFNKLNPFNKGFGKPGGGGSGALVRPDRLDRNEYPVGVTPINVGGMLMSPTFDTQADFIVETALERSGVDKTPLNQTAITQAVKAEVKPTLEKVVEHYNKFTSSESGAGKSSKEVRIILEKGIILNLFLFLTAAGYTVTEGVYEREDFAGLAESFKPLLDQTLGSVTDETLKEVSSDIGIEPVLLKDSLTKIDPLVELINKEDIWLGKNKRAKKAYLEFVDSVLAPLFTAFPEFRVGANIIGVVLAPEGTVSSDVFKIPVAGVDPVIVKQAAMTSDLIKTTLVSYDKEAADRVAVVNSDESLSETVKKEKISLLNKELDKKKRDARLAISKLSPGYEIARICDETNSNIRIRAKIAAEMVKYQTEQQKLGRTKVSLAKQRENSPTIATLREKVYKEFLDKRFQEVRLLSAEEQAKLTGSESVIKAVAEADKYDNAGTRLLAMITSEGGADVDAMILCVAVGAELNITSKYSSTIT